ncbi:hypothetical protein [Streptomyces sp. NPDC016172]|uniref:hypothetical protein n=1 Tax=Streptomyces sp. NPDC016172 TaxID=3364964 RepID=UPI0037010397
MRSTALLRLAVLLTGGDRHAAEDLLQIALMKAYGRWARIEQHEAYVRQVMYRQQVNRWRLRRHRAETTVPVLPESGTDADAGADSPNGDLSGLDLRTGEQVWSGHVDTGRARPGFGESPQLLLCEDVLVARNGSQIVSLLPRIGDCPEGTGAGAAPPPRPIGEGPQGPLPAVAYDEGMPRRPGAREPKTPRT